MHAIDPYGSGIIAVGVFLMLISILGVIAVWKNKRGLVFLVIRLGSFHAHSLTHSHST